jgi:hypothetical protein
MTTSFTTLEELSTQWGTDAGTLAAAAAGHLFTALAPHYAGPGWEARLDRHEVLRISHAALLFPTLNVEVLDASVLTPAAPAGEFPTDTELNSWADRCRHGRGHDA